MESKESTNGIDTVVIDDFNAALRGCQMSARGFFFALIPLFESAQEYGTLDMDTEQLSRHFKVSLHHTRRYVYELKRKKILRMSPDGAFICNLLIRKKYQFRSVA